MSLSSSSFAEVIVESLGGLGDGIARLSGKPLFVPKSCVGDRLEVCVVRETSDKLHGMITRIITSGPSRQPAPCPYFDACGGCTLQQLVPSVYQDFKTRMFHSALSHAGFPSPDSSVLFLPPQTRRRVEFKISNSDGKIVLAFHALRSHTPVIVSECMVLDPVLQSLITPLGEALSALRFAQHIYAASLTKADSGLDLVLTLKGLDTGSLTVPDGLCENLGIARISLRAPDAKPTIVSQITPVEMQLGGYAVPLPPGAFLQATAQGQAALTEAVMAATTGASSVVDLFCGIGTYSFPLSKQVKTHAVEGENDMVQAMRASIKHHAITTLTGERRDLFKQPLTSQELGRFDAAVLNPPRLGAKAQTEQLAKSSINTVVMVSCNPATFARDGAILKKSGFKLDYAQGIDQFLWSQHLEIVAVFRRNQILFE